MEEVLGCLFFFGLLVFGLVVLFQHFEMRRRLKRLEGELRDLRSEERTQAPSPRDAPEAPTPTVSPVASAITTGFEQEERLAREDGTPEPAGDRHVDEVDDLAQPDVAVATPAAAKVSTLLADERAADREPVPSSEPPARSSRPPIEWERFLGVRGAAVLGGIALALAAVLLFKHLITNGFLTPPWRIASGVTLGVGSLVAAAVLRRRRFDAVPDALAGAGLVAFYATIYAADERYGYLGDAVSLPLMGVVTAFGCFLASRTASRIAISIAWIGGFRRTIVRHERTTTMYMAFVHLACLLITFRQF